METVCIILVTLVLIIVVNSGFNKILKSLEHLENDLSFLCKTFYKQEVQSKTEYVAKEQPVVVKEEVSEIADSPKEKVEYSSAGVEQPEGDSDLSRFFHQHSVDPACVEQPEENQDVQPLVTDNSKEEIPVESSVEEYTKEEILPEESVLPREKHDYEKLIGENWLSKIGIATLVLGIGYFVKYAIDQNWINEIGRVLLGILCGGVLIGIAHKLKDKYRTFSSILVGGGISIFYITITIAFRDYKIFSQAVSFIFLILITIFSVFLSLRYDRKELTIFSLLGGFAAPLMVSSGIGNYIVLFSYIFILNTGMLIIAFRKDWKIIGIIAGILTQIFCWTWLFVSFNKQYAGATCFIFLFYVQFYLLALIDHYRNDKKLQAFHSLLILSDNLLLYAAILYIFSGYAVNVKGIITIVIAVLNAIPLAILFRDKAIDKRLRYLLIALVMAFVSLAIPVQFNGSAITLFWAFETVILLSLWQKSKIPVFKSGFFLIQALVLLSLLMDWSDYFLQVDELRVVFNKLCMTGLTITATVWFNTYLLRKENDSDFLPAIPRLDRVFYFSGFVLLFITLFLELQHQMHVFYEPSQNFRWLSYGLYVYLFASVVAWIRRNKEYWFSALYNTLIGLILSFVIVYLAIIFGVRQEIMSGKLDNWGYFSLHYLALPCLAYCMVFVLQKKDKAIKEVNRLNLLYWMTAFVCMVVFSCEADHLLLMLFDNGQNETNLLNISHNIVYPVLWGLTSFIFMITGMKWKNRTLRIISLSLFALIIAKLYLYDIWQMGQTGRIISLIFLGVLLLVVSFLYQKLKILLKKEDDKETHLGID